MNSYDVPGCANQCTNTVGCRSFDVCKLCLPVVDVGDVCESCSALAQMLSSLRPPFPHPCDAWRIHRVTRGLTPPPDFQRSPTVAPSFDSSCPNPPSQCHIVCSLYNGTFTPADMTNTGQWRSQFQVVIAGKSPVRTEGGTRMWEARELKERPADEHYRIQCFQQDWCLVDVVDVIGWKVGTEKVIVPQSRW